MALRSMRITHHIRDYSHQYKPDKPGNRRSSPDGFMGLMSTMPLKFDPPSCAARFEHCQYILGKDGWTRNFCKEPIHKGSYCEQHDRICYVRK